MKNPEHLCDADLIARYEAVRIRYGPATPIRLELERRCREKGRVHDGRIVYSWSVAEDSLVRGNIAANPHVKSLYVPHYGRSIELAQEQLYRRHVRRGHDD